jgi:flagellar basal-body rod protein FlgC
MSLFNLFDVAASAMTAQSQRLNAVASNLANAESVVSSNGQPYRAKQVVFSTVPVGKEQAAGVRVSSVIEDQSAPKLVYDPKHPAANAQGFVSMPNVNVVEEMVNMISASRSYQNSVELMNTAKSLALKTLSIGQ